ncbi:MAG: hypothetical protein ACUVR8_08150 [Acidobacteriota bacterium]
MDSVALELPVPYIGKNVERKHIEEFFRYHREPDEVVIALFDGIIFDGDGKRVGGLTLHDYVILTDRHFVLWARGLQSDVLDRLDYRGVRLETKPVDTLHGELALEFMPPAVPKPLTARVDLLPIMDLPALGELFDLTKAVVTRNAEQSNGQPKTSEAQLPSSQGGKDDATVAQIERIRVIIQESHAKRGATFKAPPPPPARTMARTMASDEDIAKAPSLDSPFGTGRPVSNASYAVYRIAQAAKDAVETLPTEIGKTIGLDETLSKLVDRIPKVEDIGQITALIEALNKLLITVSENPAARAFVLQAIDRMIEQGSPLKQLLAFVQNAGKPAAKPTSQPVTAAPATGETAPAGGGAATAGTTEKVVENKPGTVPGTRRMAVKVSFATNQPPKLDSPAPPLSITYKPNETAEATQLANASS